MPPSLEALSKSDTLILKLDGTFLSGFYGSGTYNIDYRFLRTEIDLSYDYRFGKGIYGAFFSNKIYENPKIILNYDLNQYYEKVN